MIEILELGCALRRQAELSGGSINESHFLVHEVLLQAFADDPRLTSSGALRGELSSRLSFKLVECDIGHRVSL